MAEWFVGPIMDKLINACFEYLKDQAIWQKSMEEALERLQKIHPMIQSVVFAFSQAQIRDQNPVLDKWIWQLRDAIDEADDVLDEFEYMKHEEQLTKNKNKRKGGSIMSLLFESARKIRKVGEPALKINPKLKRLEEVVQNLDKVSAEVSIFLHLLESTKQEQQLDMHKTRETGSLPKNDLIGRVKDKEFVMQWLRKPSNEVQTLVTDTSLYRNISLLSVVGHGGMGKTTLLQHVCEDKMTNQFDLKMWVCISNNFDMKRVITDMLESLIKKKPELDSLDALQGSLKSEVMSKKFLLVLDDIWEDGEGHDKSKWENVLAPLAYGSLGSKILVTTRMDSVALMIAMVMKRKKEILRLEGLEENECLQLLNTHAFADVENPNNHKKLISISAKIVKKLLGSPLAAKVIGGVLNSSFDEKHWNNVLNNDIISAELGHNDILSIIRLSYIFLPKSLQNCFAFCCIFPQDHIFYKDDLVRMWIALGFISPPYILGETLEDIGGRYFDILVKKSFFDEFHRTYYKMHNLLHELAQSISTQECFRAVGDEDLFFRIPETIRHLYVKTSNLEVLKKLMKFKHLHSLFLSYEGNDQDLVDILNEFFKASRSIRLLYINDRDLKMIPEAIGYLIHLRYLRLAYTSVTLLPRSISNLYHLQFMIYDERLWPLPDDFLPMDMNNLSNLRYLKLPCDILSRMHGIGKLTSLQELDWFYVKKDAGYKIEELKHMNDLRQLKIYHLENVKDDTEACSAKLYDKRNLTDFFLQWGRLRKIVDVDLDEKVLDNLQPHSCLKKLRIYAYMGARTAIWLNNVHLISNLEYIQLDRCLEWQTLPPFGQLPYLKSLYLNNIPKVRQFDNKFHGNDKDRVFPSLEVLHLERLEALEDWFDATTYDFLFPCLTELYLRNCPNLQELPSLPPKLMKLEIDDIRWKGFNWLQGASNCCSISIQNCSNLIYLRGLKEVETTQNCQLILNELVINDPSVLLMEPLRSINSIQKLEIQDNDKLVSFPIEAEQWFLQFSQSLRHLKFIKLKSLQSLPSSLSNLSTLKILHLKSIPLQKLPVLPHSLCELYLEDFDKLDCLPPCILSLSSFQKLHIKMVPQLKEISDLPPSLCELDLSDLDNLDFLPSCLPSLYSLHKLHISNLPQLRELPDFSPSLESLTIEGCHPELMKRYSRFQALIGAHQGETDSCEAPTRASS